MNEATIYKSLLNQYRLRSIKYFACASPRWVFLALQTRFTYLLATRLAHSGVEGRSEVSMLVYKAPRVRGPTKIHRRRPSPTATSSPTTSTGKTTIISASLVSFSVGAALALGSSNASGDPSADEECSGNGRDHDTVDDSGQNG